MEKSKNINKLIIVLSIFVILYSHNAYSQKISVYNEQEVQNGIEFFLPKLKLEIKIDLTKTTYNPEFNLNTINKHLPIPLKKQYTNFKISSIRINKIWLPDSNKHFIIETTSKQKFYFSQSMILLSINTPPSIVSSFPHNNLITKQISPTSYNQFFIKKNYKKTTDTTYKTIIKDSVAIKKPIYTKVTKTKTEEDKVKDLVHYLVKTRKRKFRLISGLDTNNYNPTTYKERLKNLDSLENKLYKIITGENTRKYSYIFNIDLNKKTDTIAYYTASEGLDTTSGTPIIIKIKGSTDTHTNNTSKSKTGIPYNITTSSHIEIWLGNQLLYTEEIIIPQPNKVNYITTSTKSMEYYPCGSIKNVTFK